MATPRVIDIGRGNLTHVITGLRRGVEVLPEALAKRGVELIREAFEMGGLPEKKWKELSGVTLEIRSEEGVDSTQILVKTAKMESSTFVRQVGPNEWVFGINDPKAAIHEFGAVVKVTDAMRMYLHSRGIHLSANKKQIIIPERPIMRPVADRLEKEYSEIYKRELGYWTRARIRVAGWFGRS